MNGSGGAIWNPGNPPNCSGAVPDELVEHPQDRARVFQVVEDRPREHLIDLVQAKLERRHDAEVAAAAAEPPEQILVLALAGGDELPVCRDDVGRDQIVDRQPASTREVADAAAQRQARDARRGDDPAGRRQTEGVRRVVEISPGGSRVGACRLVSRIDTNRAHRRHVDHQAAIVGSEPGRAVPTAANGEIQSVLSSEVDTGDHVGHLLGAKYGQRTLVEHAVMHGARLTIVIVGGGDHLTAHLLAQMARHQPRWSTPQKSLPSSRLPRSTCPPQ